MKIVRLFSGLILLASTAPLIPSVWAQNAAPMLPPSSESVVQLGSGWGNSSEPLVRLSRALAQNTTARQFRVTWNFTIAQSGAKVTTLYNRKSGVLTVYWQHFNEDGIAIKRYELSRVTDEMIRRLAEAYEDDEGWSGPEVSETAFFPRLTEVGAQLRTRENRFVPHPQN